MFPDVQVGKFGMEIIVPALMDKASIKSLIIVFLALLLAIYYKIAYVDVHQHIFLQLTDALLVQPIVSIILCHKDVFAVKDITQIIIIASHVILHV